MPLKTLSCCTLRKINFCGDGLHISEQHLFKMQRHKSTLYLSNDFTQYYCITLLISKHCANRFNDILHTPHSHPVLLVIRVYQNKPHKISRFSGLGSLVFFTLVKENWTVLPSRKRQHTKTEKWGAFCATD